MLRQRGYYLRHPAMLDVLQQRAKRQRQKTKGKRKGSDYYYLRHPARLEVLRQRARQQSSTLRAAVRHRVQMKLCQCPRSRPPCRMAVDESAANESCVGPSSEGAGKASSCEGCPNQQACASEGAKGPGGFPRGAVRPLDRAPQRVPGGSEVPGWLVNVAPAQLAGAATSG